MALQSPRLGLSKHLTAGGSTCAACNMDQVLQAGCGWVAAIRRSSMRFETWMTRYAWCGGNPCPECPEYLPSAASQLVAHSRRSALHCLRLTSRSDLRALQPSVCGLCKRARGPFLWQVHLYASLPSTEYFDETRTVRPAPRACYSTTHSLPTALST